MLLNFSFNLLALYQKKMIFATLKLYGSTMVLNAILLKAQLINWAEFGIAGAVIGALFALVYFILKPMINMMVEDKKSDNELKAQLVENNNALQMLIVKSDLEYKQRFTDIDKGLHEIKEIITDTKKKDKG